MQSIFAKQGALFTMLACLILVGSLFFSVALFGTSSDGVWKNIMIKLTRKKHKIRNLVRGSTKTIVEVSVEDSIWQNMGTIFWNTYEITHNTIDDISKVLAQ